MEERVIHEIRLIETDDGYRIEIKGDKDWIRRHGFDPRALGLGTMKHGMSRHHHHRHPHHGRGGFMGNMWFARGDSSGAYREDDPAGEA